MSNDSQDLGQWLQELMTRSVAEQVRATQRYTDLMQRLSRGELNEQTVREEYMHFAREETTRYARNLASLSLSYYNALLEISRNYNDRFFEQVLGGGLNGKVDDKAHTSPPERIELELCASAGKDAASSFVIENRRTEAIDVSFIVSEFTDEQKTVSFRPPLQLQPPRFTIGPHEERVVSVRLPLLTELFSPGQLYTATVIVGGYDNLELLLKVRVESESQPEINITPIEPQSKAKKAVSKSSKKSSKPTVAKPSATVKAGAAKSGKIKSAKQRKTRKS